jgi:hypothetical protein
MHSISVQLVEIVKQKASSGDSVLAVIDTEDDGKQLLALEFSPYYGLLVNQQPATLNFYRDLSSFHILETGASSNTMMLH